MLKSVLKAKCSRRIFLFCVLICVFYYVIFATISIQTFIQKIRFRNETFTHQPTAAEIELSANDLYLNEFIRLVNDFGNTSEPIKMDNLTECLTESAMVPWKIEEILENITAIYEDVEERKKSWPGNPNSILGQGRNKTKIYLAVVACGDRFYQGITMLKSAMLFSQDAKLHVIIYYDDTSKQTLAYNLLELKITAEAMEWEFTFEMHEGSYPDNNDYNWEKAYLKCCNQRLFFPSLLPHIDAVIYLDTDSVVLSNLTDLWTDFGKKLKENKMFAGAQNSEPGIYDIYNPKPVPHIEPMGINSGVLLMNLTKLRTFNLEKRSIGILEAYKEHVRYPDQDILNMIFGAFPENTASLECSQNFYRVYCDNIDYPSTNETTGSAINNLTEPRNRGFCHSVSERGIEILHGVSGTFHSHNRDHMVFPQVYQAFTNLDLITDSYLKAFKELRKQFEALQHSPCPPLTPDQLYRNGERYLKALE